VVEMLCGAGDAVCGRDAVWGGDTHSIENVLVTYQNTKGGKRPGEKDRTGYSITQVNIAYSPHTPTLTSTHLDNNW
jgi:hypothetical protein